MNQHRGATTLAIMLAVLLLVGAFLWACNEQPVARSSTNYGWVKSSSFTVTATGAAGAAVGSQSSDGTIAGHIYAVHVDYAPSISDTTDLVLSLSSPSLTVMTLSNNITDGWYYPSAQQTGNTGSGVSGAYDRLPFVGRMTATVAESTATDVVTVTVWYGE